MAGTGKRGDCKKPSISDNYRTYFGKHGFKKKNAKVIKAVNLAYFQQKIDNMVLQGSVTIKGDVYTVDLSKLGFDKLLGTGNLTKKINVTANYASASAVEKVKKAGGSVKLPEVKEAEPAKVVEKPKAQPAPKQPKPEPKPASEKPKPEAKK